MPKKRLAPPKKITFVLGFRPQFLALGVQFAFCDSTISGYAVHLLEIANPEPFCQTRVSGRVRVWREPDIPPGPVNRGRFPLEHFPRLDVSPCSGVSIPPKSLEQASPPPNSR